MPSTSRMNSSSIACRMEYRWNGRGFPSASGVPNISSVLNLGVAVNAKNERFFRLPRADMERTISSS